MRPASHRSDDHWRTRPKHRRVRRDAGTLVAVSNRRSLHRQHGAEPVVNFDGWAEAVRTAPPPTPDDVSITWDGRALDTKEKWLAFLKEIEAERAAGITFEDIEARRGDYWPRTDWDWDPVADPRA